MPFAEGNTLYSFIKKLYPIPRSISGEGARETLQLISEIIPLEITEVPTGTKVLDWEIPDEWNIRDAWIKNEQGEKIIDFKKSNLHVLNYSIPVNKKVGLSELKEHIFTNPEQPNWIPYRTSFHNRNWGFCMSHNQFEKLKDETYEVVIDSKLGPGYLTYGEHFIKGKSDEEVLISTHICHPSLANDNLSGISVATYLAKELAKLNLKYSYRFLFIPVTIGSIAWLSNNEERTESIKHGLVLTLLGDESKFHYKRSRQGDTEIDRIAIQSLKEKKLDYEIRDFSPYGYDERQYCSPGFNLAVGRLSRKPHGEFPEYHTSADDLTFVKPEKLAESLELVKSIVDIIENNKTYLNLYPKGEPQLSKRGLFKIIGGASKTKEFEMALLWILNFSDGKNNLLDISEKSDIPFRIIYQAAEALQNVNLLKEISPEK